MPTDCCLKWCAGQVEGGGGNMPRAPATTAVSIYHTRCDVVVTPHTWRGCLPTASHFLLFPSHYCLYAWRHAAAGVGDTAAQPHTAACHTVPAAHAYRLPAGVPATYTTRSSPVTFRCLHATTTRISMGEQMVTTRTPSARAALPAHTPCLPPPLYPCRARASTRAPAARSLNRSCYGGW